MISNTKDIEVVRRCRVCDVVLTDDNQYPSMRKRKLLVCKKCHQDSMIHRDDADGKSYVCIDCGTELTDDNWSRARKRIRARVCKSCVAARARKWRSENPEKYREAEERRVRKSGRLPMNENKECPGFLGIHIAEQVLSKVFPNVVQMPVNNIGYDYICSKDKRIDVKSATASKRNGGWGFHIRKNRIADYFLCIAFDNREDLNPVHLWLIPGEKVNHKNNISMLPTTLSKWKEYEMPLDKVIACCDTMR